jgi:hypothetical protein
MATDPFPTSTTAARVELTDASDDFGPHSAYVDLYCNDHGLHLNVALLPRKETPSSTLWRNAGSILVEHVEQSTTCEHLAELAGLWSEF